MRLLGTLGCLGALALVPALAAAAPSPTAALSAETARALRAEGLSVRGGPLRFAPATPVGVLDPRTIVVDSVERRELERSARVVQRGRGVISRRALQALLGAQIATRSRARMVGADERSQAHERAATGAVAADLAPRILRALGAGGFTRPLGVDGSEAELTTQALWLRQVSTQSCRCPTASTRAVAFRLRFLRASDALRRQMVAGRFGVPLVSGPWDG